MDTDEETSRLRSEVAKAGDDGLQPLFWSHHRRIAEVAGGGSVAEGMQANGLATKRVMVEV